MSEVCPRITIAGSAGDSGKTLLSLGLLGAWRRRGIKPVAFKKGPDFIDAAWLGRAAGRSGRNLDTFLMDDRMVVHSFVRHATGADVAVIEGNRGLHDGRDAQGTHSTAVLATMLGSPVILIHQVRKATRTAAAAIMGCCAFDKNVTVAGVVLNGVAGNRHQRVVTDSLALAGGPPVVGAIPRLDDTAFLPGRHLGLVTPEEHPDPDTVIDRAADVVAEYVDLDHILELASTAPPLPEADLRQMNTERSSTIVRIGYFRDSAFTFYYPENLEALHEWGAELVPISSLAANVLPGELDGLYIGGGFPETHAQQLADNSGLRNSVRLASEAGLPIYAECGGLIYLAVSLKIGDATYPMAGVFPVQLALEKKPQGHGYCRLIVDRPNPYFAVGSTINGHEFHYTRPIEGAEHIPTACGLEFGTGLFAGRDGMVKNKTMAAYCHLHALGTPGWAAAFVHEADLYRTGRIDRAGRNEAAGCPCSGA